MDKLAPGTTKEIRRRILFLPITYSLILSGIPVLAKAQDSAVLHLPPKWNLATCLDYAKKNNIQLNTLRLNEQIDAQTLLQAKAAKFPTLTGVLSGTFTHSTNANPVIGGFATQSTFANNYGLNSNWTVFNGGYLNQNVRVKALNVESDKLSVAENENNLTIQITQDYLNILLARESIVYAEDLLSTSQAQQDQGKELYQAGSIARNALTVLEAQTASDKYQLTAAKNLYRQNVLNLKQLLQLPSGYSMEIEVPDTVVAVSAVPPLEDVQRTAYETRPEIKNALLGEEIARTNLKMARAQSLPVATIGAALASGYSNNESEKYFTQLSNNFYQRVGLNVTIPIFNNRLYKTQIEISKVEIDQARLSKLGTQTQLSQEVEQAYINVLNTQSQYDAADVQLKASQESYRVASEQFKVGASNLVGLLQQKNLYVQALQNYMQAKYSAVLNILIYNFYKGEPIRL